METKEWYFFKWAYPCAYILRQNGVITDEQLSGLDKLYANGKAPEAEVLEKYFFAAFRRLDGLANSMKTDHWDWKVLRAYWEGGGHNRVIQHKEGNYAKFAEIDPQFCFDCQVHEVEVIGKRQENDGVFLDTLLYGEKRSYVQGKFLDAEIGDKVLTHLAYAIQLA